MDESQILQRITRIESETSNINKTLSHIKSEIQAQDSALAHRDHNLGKIVSDTEHLIKDFTEIKTNLRKYNDSIGKFAANTKERLTSLEQRSGDIINRLEKVENCKRCDSVKQSVMTEVMTVKQDVSDHKEQHKHRREKWEARQWQIVAAIIIGFIGIGIAIFKDHIFIPPTNTSQMSEIKKVLEEMKDKINQTPKISAHWYKGRLLWLALEKGRRDAERERRLVPVADFRLALQKGKVARKNANGMILAPLLANSLKE